MAKEKELELKKLEIEKAKIELEKLKIKEGLFRTLVIIVLTVSAGIGALNPKIIGNKLDPYIYGALIFIDGFVLVFAFWLWLTIRKKLKEL
ncbi:hypothetical protein [Persephonella sp.]|uniref:hypothetical protein n=1 Tax=Persephonella sp. TaxID=2060922 RepID=UPI0026384EF0|nr:hypothetical protein [Persephonella sp.]